MNFTNKNPIPRRYLAASSVIIPDPRLVDVAAIWTGLYGLLLLGPSGCGKTLSAARAGAKVARERTDTWVQWVRGAAEEIETLKSARALIIDELGYERFPELCLEVIGSRHDWERPTIVTSGLKIEQFIERYSEATARRISETGKGAVINCWKAAPNVHA